MPYADWRITGPEMNTCNCAWGCPCQFNAPPTRGHCQAAIGMRIDRGHFNDISLDGLIWAGVYRWPGPVHEGGGEALGVIDARASEAQRTALLTILAGKETEPGATIFNVFAGTFSKVHKPLFLPIAFEIDVVHCTGRVAVEGVFEARGEPMRDPFTGKPHRARLQLPHGFEFLTCEFGSGTAQAQRPAELGWSGSHAHFALLDLGPRGPIRH
jgi:hypothetical protein